MSVRRHSRRHKHRLLVALLILFVMALMAVVLLFSPMLSLKNIRVIRVVSKSVAVSTEVPVSTAVIKAESGLVLGFPMIDINSAEVSTRLEKLPWIKNAVVEKVWPNTVKILITLAQPVVQIDTQTGWMLVSNSAKVLMRQPVAFSHVVRLLHSTANTTGTALSVDFPNYSPGDYLPASYTQALLAASAVPDSLISDVQWIKPSGGGVLLSLKEGPTVVWLGAGTDLKTKFNDLTTLLEHLNLAGEGWVDLSVPQDLAVGKGPLPAYLTD